MAKQTWLIFEEIYSDYRETPDVKSKYIFNCSFEGTEKQAEKKCNQLDHKNPDCNFIAATDSWVKEMKRHYDFVGYDLTDYESLTKEELIKVIRESKGIQNESN